MPWAVKDAGPYDFPVPSSVGCGIPDAPFVPSRRGDPLRRRTAGSEQKKAFPFGEGGFFSDRREMKKTEEVLPQYGFAAR